MMIRWISLLLILTLLTGCSHAEDGPLAEPSYPDMPPYPSTGEDYAFLDPDAYSAWRQAVRAQARENGYEEGLAPFLAASGQVFLGDAAGENRVYSPLSLYMALAMLAETTGGETRSQVLTLLGHENVDTLRSQAADLWNANYRSGATMTRTLATSLWLNEDIRYQQETVDALAKHYYAASYRGRMGSPEYDRQLHQWLNSNTLGLLEEQIGQLHLPEDTAAAIASTVAFRARWGGEFDRSETTQDTFHAADGDVTCDFMHASYRSTFYWGERFQAIRLGFEQDGCMWIILPDEGVSPEALLSDTDCLPVLTGTGTPESRSMIVHMSIPKFEVTSQMEMSAGLQRLGVTNAFSRDRADFAPLTGSELPVWLDRVQHDARVVIDEEGCEAAAYTLMLMAAGAAPPEQLDEIDFVADRPFLFVITGANELPLFIGVVNHP